MGIELVNVLLLRYASTLSGRAFKVLCRMATIALDQPNGKGQPARLYFAGEEPLAQVLYGTADGYSPNQLREVRRIVADLVSAGLIERVDGHGRRKHRVTFRLNISLAVGGQIAHPNAGDSAHPTEGEIAPQKVGILPTPRTESGTTEDLPQDSKTQSTASTTGHAQPHTDGEIRIGGWHHYAPDEAGLSCTFCDLPETHGNHRRTA